MDANAKCKRDGGNAGGSLFGELDVNVNSPRQDSRTSNESGPDLHSRSTHPPAAPVVAKGAIQTAFAIVQASIRADANVAMDRRGLRIKLDFQSLLGESGVKSVSSWTLIL